MMQRAVAIPAAIVLVIQGLVILFVVSADILLRKPELLEKLPTRFAKLIARGGKSHG